MRQWVTPRSLMLHAAFLVIAFGCLMAAWWQVHRAMAGNTLSYLYSVEWPAFAVVSGIGWWQMFHDTPEDIARRKEYHTRMRAASAAVVARTLPRSALAITASSVETSPMQSLPPPSQSGGTGLEPLHAGAVVLPMDDREGAGEDGAEDEMTEYNRMLALLAVRGKAKTWRNPRGL